MKFLLIDPPYRVEEIGGKKHNFKSAVNKIPSLGLAYLAAVAERAGCIVKIADCTLGSSYKDLIKITEEFRPQVIGITATTPTFRNAVYVASVLRNILPEAILICGGAHPTASPIDSLNAGVFDFLVLGEGEETFLELLSYVEDKRPVSAENIRGIAFKKNGEIVITPARPRIENLDSLPFPARHLLPPLSTYLPTPASYRRLPLAVIITSRGCPSRCTFCDRAVFGEKFRQRSVSNVMAEVEEVILKYKAKEIRFFDDTFTLNPAFVDGICRSMKKLHPATPWTCLTKVTAVNYEMLKMMRDSGCWQVLFGLESGDDYVLSKLCKGNTVSQNRGVVFWAKRAGLNVRADFLVGSPWETKETFRKTVKFARNLPLDFAHFNKFVPYPGTAIYNDLISNGNRINFNDNGSYIGNHNDFVYLPETFSNSEYTQWLNKAYKEFYLRPRYITRRLLSIRTFPEFTGQLRGLYSVVSL